MSNSPIDTFVFAPLAPILGILLFWFIQLIFIESQKYLLSLIWHKHQPLCRLTNFIGIFFQTICHALGYTVTKSGVSDFYISINYGRVFPKKDKQGIFKWVANAFLFIGPFFIPSFVLFLYLFFLIRPTLEISTVVYDTFSLGLITLGTNFYIFSLNFFNFLFNIDLLHPLHLGFLLFLIFLGLGIRPSYIGEKKKEKVDMIYDLKNIKTHLLQKPLYIFILFAAAYVFFYISLFLKQNWYSLLFSILGWLSIIAIVALLITHGLLLIIRVVDKLPKYSKLISYLMLPLSYAMARVVFFCFPFRYSNSISLIVMLSVTFLTIWLLLNYKTNKFKTKSEMERGEAKNGRGRVIKK